MFIIDLSANTNMPVSIDLLVDEDYKDIAKKRFFFDWKLERGKTVYKLTIASQNEILGLLSIEYFDDEERLEIRLLEVSKENVGATKLFGGIAGNMIAFAARLAVKRYGSNAVICLVPKTVLVEHYIVVYGFELAGRSLFMEGKALWSILKKYNYE